MNDSIFDNFKQTLDFTDTYQRKSKVHIFLFMLELIKLLFSIFIFFSIVFVYLNKKHRYLQRRNITRQHRNYFIVNCTYISVVLAFATAFGLFSYYFPKITFIYICFKSRNLI